jgi:signal transduction histidine kinase
MAPDDISFTDLIASSIHDMKNSLNLQVSALERIAGQCRETGDSAMFQDLGRVIYQANRMNLNLVELLSLYKLSKAIYPMDVSEQSVAEVVQEAVQQNQSMMEFKGIVVTQDCAPDCYWYMDRELVKGVLVNALNNAYQYTHDKIHVCAAIRGERLELRVEDNGPGYPARMLVSHDVTAQQGVHFDTGSTGLGFYFSNQVARLHKNREQRGTLAIENGGSLGGGCFVLSLP